MNENSTSTQSETAPEPAPEMFSREQMIAEYNAGYIAAVERRPDLAPDDDRAALARVRAIVFRSDTQQARIRDLTELLDPAPAGASQ